MQLKPTLICVYLTLASEPCCLAADVAGAVPNPQSPCVLRVEQDSNPYPQALLEMAISKTESDYGRCTIETTAKLSHARLEAQIQEGRINVGWMNTSRQRERTMIPVRIPLHEGLGGYRILLIRKSDEAKFASIRSVDELRRMRAGRVDDDSTRLIFEHNRLPTDYTGAHEQLFPMLTSHRVDYLPRAIYKASIDADRIKELPLTIAPGVLIHYNIADYFFVGLGQRNLAERLRKGLERGIKDGTRDKLRESVLNWSHVLSDLKVGERHIVELQNPDLPQETPIGQKGYWITLKTKSNHQ